MLFRSSEQAICPIIEARRQGLVFQVQGEDHRWQEADPAHVFLLKPPAWLNLKVNEISIQTRTPQHNIEIGLHLLRHFCYAANIDLPDDWDKALKKANRWVGREHALLSARETVSQCFDQAGNMKHSLLCAWKGDFSVIQSCFQAVGLPVHQSDEPFSNGWSRLFIQTPSDNRV